MGWRDFLWFIGFILACSVFAIILTTIIFVIIAFFDSIKGKKKNNIILK